MTSKERAELRAKAHHLRPIASIGKGGISDDFISNIDISLEALELIKVNILQNCDIPAEEAAQELSKRTRSEVVQVVGKKITLYRYSHTKNKVVHTPNSEGKKGVSKHSSKFAKPKRVRQKSSKR